MDSMLIEVEIRLTNIYNIQRLRHEMNVEFNFIHVVKIELDFRSTNSDRKRSQKRTTMEKETSSILLNLTRKKVDFFQCPVTYLFYECCFFL